MDKVKNIFYSNIAFLIYGILLGLFLIILAFYPSIEFKEEYENKNNN